MRVKENVAERVIRVSRAQLTEPAPDPLPDAEEGWIAVELTFVAAGAAAGVLAGFGADVRVLGPQSVRTRLQVYNDQTTPVVDFFRQRGKLSVVDGVGSLDEVFTRIIEALTPVPAVG